MHPLLNAAMLAAVATGPDPVALATQAAQAYAAGDFTAAAARYREALGAAPSAPGVLVGLGRSLARLGQTHEALDWLSRAADTGAGADAAAVAAAFGASSDSGEVRALVSRFRGNLTPVVRSTLEFRLAEKDLLPESVAYDPADGAWYVGSMRKRKVVVVRGGVARDFVTAKAHGLGAVLGMKVDAARRELWVNSCHADFSPAVIDPEPQRLGEAALLRFDLGTGKLVSTYRTGSKAQPVCFNDLALTPAGDVYMSTGADGVYRVSRKSGRLERFVETPGLLVNGIAAAADGRRLYLADHMRGVIMLDVASRELRPLPVPPATALGGVDGLYVHGASLVGIQNGLAAGPERVVQAFLDADGSRATCVEMLERNHPDYDVPTTGVIVGDALVYVAGSQLNRLDDKGQPLPQDRLRESAVLRLDLLARCGVAGPGARIDLEAARRELLDIHEADRRAHFTTDAVLLGTTAGESFLTVSRGKLETVTAAGERRMFEGYFRGARYEAWDDLEPPVVHVSDDGSMAWIVSRVRVKRTEPGADGQPRERAFVYAGIMTYARRDGRWTRTANVSTFE
jgi:Tetratricopeptide repeat